MRDFEKCAYNSFKYGGMNTLGSERKEPDAARAEERVPLSGEKLALAVEAMKSPNFLVRLTARIMKLARKMGFHSPFKDGMDLPGGKSAADLAGDIVEKAMDGTFTWDQNRIPSFYHFCLSRAESILSNWLVRAKRSQTMSHVLIEDLELGGVGANALNTATAPDDIYAVLRVREGGLLGDRFLEDFALSLPDGSPEQAIILAVFDDRDCGNRAYCCKKLKILGETYDAATKRLLRRLPAFLHEWRAKNKVGDVEWKEAR
jgi:hypothetical protein